MSNKGERRGIGRTWRVEQQEEKGGWILGENYSQLGDW